MPATSPPNADDVRQLVEERLAALDGNRDTQETVTVEWRGEQLPVPVISMPVRLLHYNPDTHRIRAQRSFDPERERDLETDPYGAQAQAYLHKLLTGDPTDPRKTDPSFAALKEDLAEHGQHAPGIISRNGVLVNGNTRRAALEEIGVDHIRVGVLPKDAGHEDLRSIELSLQLRKDHKRDYSFMNLLLAIEERVAAGKLDAVIQADFHIKPSTLEKYRWIYALVVDAIERSKVAGAHDKQLSLSFSDFEAHQGKLEELHRTYAALARTSSDEADALREQRLLALLLDKSKTDLRLIEPNFVERYMPQQIPAATPAPALRIPGTSITTPGPSQQVRALRQLTTRVLQAKSVEQAQGELVVPSDITAATTLLTGLGESLVKALDLAGKQTRVVKRRFAPADRISDACDDLALAASAVADARAASNFDSDSLDDALIGLRSNLRKLAGIVLRDSSAEGEGAAWLRAVGNLPERVVDAGA